jgi:hypothetical protein
MLEAMFQYIPEIRYSGKQTSKADLFQYVSPVACPVFSSQFVASSINVTLVSLNGLLTYITD